MVSLMKKMRIIILFVVVSVFVLSPMIVMGQKILVFDDANLFTQEEKTSIDADVNNLSDSYNMDIVVVTTNDAMGKTSREYADDYFDYGDFGVGENHDGILFLIDIDNRETYISTSGIGIRYLTDERIESILNTVFDSGLTEGDYYGATMGFLRGTKSFLERGIQSDQYNAPEKVVTKNRLTSSDVIISIIGGFATGGIFYFVTKSRYKMKNPRNTYSYKANSLINLNSKEDKLINTYVTHRMIPKPTNTSSSSTGGRSTTHKSSSGRSHGGGGRKF